MPWVLQERALTDNQASNSQLSYNVSSEGMLPLLSCPFIPSPLPGCSDWPHFADGETEAQQGESHIIDCLWFSYFLNSLCQISHSEAQCDCY